jgi:putative addiction module component (TIGR02574 family)
MSGKEILELALKLKPDERFSVVEALLRSLDTPDASLDALWAVEAEKRLNAYRAGTLAGIPFDEVFAEH